MGLGYRQYWEHARDELHEAHDASDAQKPEDLEDADDPPVAHVGTSTPVQETVLRLATRHRLPGTRVRFRFDSIAI